MKLRYALIGIFCGLTLIPLLVFWVWPHSQVLESEFHEVQQKHLLIAKNQSAALQRYHNDVTDVFELVASNLVLSNEISRINQLLENLNIYNICIVDTVSNTLIQKAVPGTVSCNEVLTRGVADLVSADIKSDASTFSTVLADKNDNPIMYIYRRYGNFTAIASLSTQYFIDLGKSVFFGVKGHAAIVDHEGNVLAHPLDSWIQARKSLAKVSAVQRMLRGETGVETFYSPALKGDMIAGITSVQGTGWGVMVPQPVSELYEKAEVANRSAMTIFIVGLVVALAFAYWLAQTLLKPINKLMAAYQRISGGSMNREFDFDKRWYVPVEFLSMQTSFNKMVTELDQNINKIKAMAYVDPVTESFNRRAFSLRVENQLTALSQEKQSASLLFFDLDGFKAVNDTHGHDAGDYLLKGVIQRTARALKLERKSDLSAFEEEIEVQPERRDYLKPILARLGGDEFAIFIPYLVEKDEIETIIAAIYAELCEPFILDNAEATIGASIGIVRFPDHGEHLELLLKRADTAMYAAKKANKNTFRYYQIGMENTPDDEQSVA